MFILTMMISVLFSAQSGSVMVPWLVGASLLALSEKKDKNIKTSIMVKR